MLKRRADTLLVEKGLCESRSRAARLIMAGQVRIGSDHVVAKASEGVDPNADLIVLEPFPYVSRGATKLLAGLAAFPCFLEGRVALDIGASTGGFTDVLLQRGAKRVYAVDVGYGQLHAKLRNDPRVISLERFNARHLTAEQVAEAVDIIVADLSFISLTKVLPACAPLTGDGGRAYLLVKPQFEAKREEVGKGGVVRDPAVRQACVDQIVDFAASQLGWTHLGTVPSPIKGPKGNQEFITAFSLP